MFATQRLFVRSSGVFATNGPDAPILAASTSTTDLLIAGGIMVGCVLVIVTSRRVVHTLERSVRLQSSVSAVLTRFIGGLVFLVGLVYAFRQLGVQVGPLLGALGIGGLVIAMSLQPVLGNLVGSVLIHSRRPFRRGDQISSNGTAGTVLDVNGRAVVMMTFDGERMHIPNLKVLDEPLVNQTANPHRRTLIPFQVAYSSELRTVQRVLEQALRGLDALADAPAAEILATGFDDSGINLVARIWHPSEELSARWAISECTIAIHETLRRENITIPFPQRVLHFAEPDSAEARTMTNVQIAP